MSNMDQNLYWRLLLFNWIVDNQKMINLLEKSPTKTEWIFYLIFYRLLVSAILKFILSSVISEVKIWTQISTLKRLRADLFSD